MSGSDGCCDPVPGPLKYVAELGEVGTLQDCLIDAA